MPWVRKPPPKPVMPDNVTVRNGGALPDPPAPSEKALARHASGEIAVIPVATTAKELPKEGALAAAQVAPSSGPIDAIAGTPVVTVLQGFLRNTTVRLWLLVFGLGVAKGGKVFWDAMGVVLAAGQHFFQIEWQETFFDAADAALIFIVPAIGGMILKALDNNLVNLPQFFGKKLAGDPNGTKGP